MKQIVSQTLLSVLALLGTLPNLLAQTPPTVDNTVIPAAPDTQIYLVLDTTGALAPGDTGANVTWDFSAEQAQYADTVVWTAPQPADSFPAATHSGQVGLTVSGFTFDQQRFYQLSTNAFVEIGYSQDSLNFQQQFGVNAFTYERNYTTPQGGDTLWEFPLNFGDQHQYPQLERILEGEASDFGLTFDVEVRRTSQREVVADGWGELRLPDTTYANALRVRTVEVSGDTIYIFDTGTQTWVPATTLVPQAYSQRSQDTLYSWFVPGLGEVMQHRKLTALLDTVPDTLWSVRYLDVPVVPDTTDTTDTTVSRLDPRLVEATVFPNPSAGRLTLQLGELPNARRMHLRLLDPRGRSLWEARLPVRRTTPLNLPELPAGHYRLLLEAGNRLGVMPVVLR